MRAGKAKPLPYQRQGVLDCEDFIRDNGGALLADEMGLGKTLQALWLLRRQRIGRPTLPALVVCPASVKYHWEHEAKLHVGLRSHVITGQRVPPGGLPPELPQLLIINPDILSYWVEELLRHGLQTLVLDECQLYANPNSQRTRAMLALARGVPNRLALSGTPLVNAPGELWPTLHALRPDQYSSLFAFAEDYCRPRKRFGRWEYKGAKNLDRLRAQLRRTCMVRRLKTDVLQDLPSKVRRVVPVDLANRDEYHHASTDFRGWLRQNYTTAKARRACRAEAVTRVGYLLRLAARLKARSVVAWANRFLAEYPYEKLVLFGVHSKMLRLLERRVAAKHVTVDGKVTGHRRQLAVDKFKHDAKTRVFIGNIRAAGTGVDGLQAVCSNLAFVELWWRPGDHVQAEDRIHRMGQAGGAWCHYLVAGGTVEDVLCRVIQQKQATIHATLDKAGYTGGMDVWDQLLEALRDASE